MEGIDNKIMQVKQIIKHLRDWIHFLPQKALVTSLLKKGCWGLEDVCSVMFLPNSYTEPMERQQSVKRFRAELVRPQEPVKVTFMTGRYGYWVEVHQ